MIWLLTRAMISSTTVSAVRKAGTERSQSNRQRENFRIGIPRAKPPQSGHRLRKDDLNKLYLWNRTAGQYLPSEEPGRGFQPATAKALAVAARTSASTVTSLWVGGVRMNCCTLLMMPRQSSLASSELACRNVSFKRPNPNSSFLYLLSNSPRETSKREAPGSRATMPASAVA